MKNRKNRDFARNMGKMRFLAPFLWMTSGWHHWLGLGTAGWHGNAWLDWRGWMTRRPCRIDSEMEVDAAADVILTQWWRGWERNSGKRFIGPLLVRAWYMLEAARYNSAQTRVPEHTSAEWQFRDVTVGRRRGSEIHESRWMGGPGSDGGWKDKLPAQLWQDPTNIKLFFW